MLSTPLGATAVSRDEGGVTYYSENNINKSISANTYTGFLQGINKICGLDPKKQRKCLQNYNQFEMKRQKSRKEIAEEQKERAREKARRDEEDRQDQLVRTFLRAFHEMYTSIPREIETVDTNEYTPPEMPDLENRNYDVNTREKEENILLFYTNEVVPYLGRVLNDIERMSEINKKCMSEIVQLRADNDTLKMSMDEASQILFDENTALKEIVNASQGRELLCENKYSLCESQNEQNKMYMYIAIGALVLGAGGLAVMKK